MGPLSELFLKKNYVTLDQLKNAVQEWESKGRCLE